METAAVAASSAGRRIMVAVDEGEESLHALNWCLANVVSPAGGDTLVLVHARRPRPVYAAMDSAGITTAADVNFSRSYGAGRALKLTSISKWKRR
jgi:hypothetical protein